MLMSPRQHRLPIYFLIRTNKVVPACFWTQEIRCRHALPDQSVSHDMDRKNHRASRYRRAVVVARREVSVNRTDEDRVRPAPAPPECAIDVHFARIPAAQDQVIQDRLILQDLRSTLTALPRLAYHKNRTPSPSGYGAKHLSFSESADIDSHWCPGGTGFGARIPRSDERRCRPNHASSAHSCCRACQKRLRPALVLSSVTSIYSLRSY